mmetsp:Transcript_14760/g.23425  ORF Transcript_14760/g.23425 Transcript_14760/m.23425 type:complete len:311 (+) Transcript_14760:655-1587(+)
MMIESRDGIEKRKPNHDVKDDVIGDKLLDTNLRGEGVVEEGGTQLRRRESSLKDVVMEGIDNDLLDAKSDDNDVLEGGNSNTNVVEGRMHAWETIKEGMQSFGQKQRRMMWNDLPRMEKMLGPEERAFVQHLFGEKRNNTLKNHGGDEKRTGDEKGKYPEEEEEEARRRFEKWKDYTENQESRRKPAAASLHYRRGKSNSRILPCSSIPHNHNENETYHVPRGGQEQAINNTNGDCSSDDFHERYLNDLAYLNPKMEKKLIRNMYRGAMRNRKKNKSDLQILSERYENLILSGAADEDSDRSRCWKSFDN